MGLSFFKEPFVFEKFYKNEKNPEGYKLYPVKWTKQIVSNLKNGQLNCV